MLKLHLNFFLAFVSFLSLTFVPAVASPQSCCISSAEQKAVAKACVCSHMSECCKESEPSTLGEDRATVTVKQVRHAHVPYNAAIPIAASRLTKLASTQPVFRKSVKQIDANNKRYLMLRVLLI